MIKKDLDNKTPQQLINMFGGVSAAIRALDKMKFERGEIAKMLNKRYQHVRNVLITPIKQEKPKVNKNQLTEEQIQEYYKNM